MNGAWRFPNNNYTNENGLDTSDMETFRKDPVSSLAREICQNSIDASNGKMPVKVHFELFEVDRNCIPNVDELASEIEACYSYQKDSPKESKPLKALKKSIAKDRIKCLRISDFNTTGVDGGATNERGTPFFNLTKGSGVSGKVGTSGGSKGIGKFASFVVSTTNTVFYSTNAQDGSKAYIGISKLRSRPIDNNDPDLLTMGIGYYGCNDKNYPILEEFYLDPSFQRGESELGTDVYIIGFNDEKGWQSDIIAKVLDSFMVAIMRGELEVSVGEQIVNKSTVKEIIFDSTFQNERTKTEIKGIRAQYELLNGDDSVSIQDIPIGENNIVTVYMKQYTAQEEANATKQCIMVRYPNMKITHITTGSFIPFSALCIIGDNDLNVKLRAIENPQHTDWEIKRLKEFPVDLKETRLIKKELETKVKEYINSVLKQSTGDSTDIEGAGEFLPSQEDLGVNEGNAITTDQVNVTQVTEVKTQNPKTAKTGEEGEGYDFDKGDPDDEGFEGRRPKKKKKKKPNPNPSPKGEPKEDPKMKDGNTPILKKVPLSGMRYRTVVTNKTNGEYDCIFTSKHTEDNCEFAIRMCGESTDKYPISIVSAVIDGKECEIQDGKIIGIKIQEGETYKISYRVNSSEMFASEVILNAYR